MSNIYVFNTPFYCRHICSYLDNIDFINFINAICSDKKLIKSNFKCNIEPFYVNNNLKYLHRINYKIKKVEQNKPLYGIALIKKNYLKDSITHLDIKSYAVVLQYLPLHLYELKICFCTNLILDNTNIPINFLVLKIKKFHMQRFYEYEEQNVCITNKNDTCSPKKRININLHKYNIKYLDINCPIVSLIDIPDTIKNINIVCNTLYITKKLFHTNIHTLTFKKMQLI